MFFCKHLSSNTDVTHFYVELDFDFYHCTTFVHQTMSMFVSYTDLQPKAINVAYLGMYSEISYHGHFEITHINLFFIPLRIDRHRITKYDSFMAENSCRFLQKTNI